jgi:predicted GTPase
MPGSARIRVLIMGAAGRDFHNFNVVYRSDPTHEVVAFTAAQIAGIAHRRYPAALAGPLYPEGIPVLAEEELEQLCRDERVEQVVFAYSDLAHTEVMHRASRALATGADFVLLGPSRTMLSARVPVVAVSAVRTGCGKSQTARWLSRELQARRLRAAVIRHPMPYGDPERQALQRFATRADLDAARCTIEEREEYEPHLDAGNVVYAGVDYERILREAEARADVILWDGGNNDFPFIRPGLHVVLVDPLRPGHESTHHPGETVLRMADVVVVTKTDAAAAADVQRVIDNVRRINAGAAIVRAASPVTVDEAAVRGRRVVVVEDGPTVTHGEMPYGAGYVAAVRAGASAVIDARAYAAPEIAAIYGMYPHLGLVVPAVGYTAAQLDALERTLNATPAEVVLSATPIDLARVISVNKPIVRVRYEFAEAGAPGLGDVLEDWLERAGLAAREE